MGPVVHSLILNRFRSVLASRVDFDNPTFLVGRNGSGKSNLADAFAFLAEAMTLPLQEVFDRRGGLDNVLTRTHSLSLKNENFGIAVECAPEEPLKNSMGNPQSVIKAARYAFEISPLPEYRFEIVREQCVLTCSDGAKKWFDRKYNDLKANIEPFSLATQKWLAPSGLAMPLMGNIFPFNAVFDVLRSMRVYCIEPAKLRGMQDPDSGASLRSDGANAASVLEEIERQSPEDVERIGQFLSSIVPGTKSVDTVQHGKKLTLEFTQEWAGEKPLEFEAFNMSDGTLRAFGLLLAVFQRPSPSLIVVEEPEASMHPAAAGAILDLLRHATKKMQVVVSTHSPEVLDARWIEGRHLRVVNWQHGATTVSGISEMPRKALQDHLMGAGELLRSEALDPGPLFDDVAEAQMALFEEVS